MKFLIITTLLLGIGTCAVKANYDGPEWATIDESNVFSSKSVVNVRNRRIVGGQIVPPHSIPFQVALNHEISTGGTRLCSGTVLGTRAVLTAARCLFQTLRTLAIAGAHDRTQPEFVQQRRNIVPSAYIVHENYVAGMYINDIAILETENAWNHNNFVQPARLPIDFPTDTFTSDVATISGWGWITNTGPASNVLRSVMVQVVANLPCSRSLPPGNVNTNTLCTLTNENFGACNDDFGGPLTVKRPGDNRPVQIGILSFVSVSFCVGTHPNSYTRVNRFLEWIQNHQPQ